MVSCNDKICMFFVKILLNLLATYYDAISPEGHVLGDHMLLGTVVATILIIDNTVQVYFALFFFYR
jgi:hypothetical protein